MGQVEIQSGERVAAVKPSVAAAWPAFCANWEGRLSWMYLDTKFLVTTGTGNLIDSIPAAQALPWYTKQGVRASSSAVEKEWRRVKGLRSLAHLSGWAYETSAVLFLDNQTIDRLLTDVTASFWSRLGQTLPQLEDYPADAQLALLDLAWQNGPAFLDLKTSGKYVWANTRTAVFNRKWSDAAAAVPGTGPRADTRKRLFRNAAVVERDKIDPTILWNGKTPTKTQTKPVADEVKGFDMAAAVRVYYRTDKAQSVPGGKPVGVLINSNGDASVTTQPNDGTDVLAAVRILNNATTDAVVDLWWAFVDYEKGKPTEIVLDWLGVSAAVPPNDDPYGMQVTFKGPVGKSDKANKSRRLRLFIKSSVPVQIAGIQIAGWRMP